MGLLKKAFRKAKSATKTGINVFSGGAISKSSLDSLAHKPLGFLSPEIPGIDMSSLDAIQAEARKKEEEEKKKREALTKKLRENLESEEKSKLELAGSAEDRRKAIDAQLQERLTGLDIEAKEAREQVGQAFAQRGLSRSTFAQKGQEQVIQEEQQAKSEMEKEAEIGKEQATLAEQKIKQEIDERRKQVELEIEFADLSQLVQQKNFLTQTGIQQRFQTEMQQIGLQAQQQVAAMQTMSSLASSAALIYALGCWVARAIFGEENDKWKYARYYITTYSPSWFCRLYLKHGEWFAVYVKKYKLLKWVLRPLFEVFAYIGKRGFHGNYKSTIGTEFRY